MFLHLPLLKATNLRGLVTVSAATYPQLLQQQGYLQHIA